jgi:hypothetical protein
MSLPTATDLTVACHVRPSLVLEPIDSKVETLRACERDGVLDSLLLRSWPAEVAMLEDSPHPEVLEQYDRFVGWAERADVDVHPPFQRRETTSIASDRTVERLVTPGIVLAFYDGDGIVGVFPHTDDETTHTVPEAIAALRTGELPEPLRGHPAFVDAGASDGGDDAAGVAERSVPRPAKAPGDGGAGRGDEAPAGGARSSCPDCGSELTNVQGILDCGGCEWRSERAGVRLATR